MSNLVVIVFDNETEAGKVREALNKLEHQGRISLDDSAVVVKDSSGKIHVKNQMDRGIIVGAVGGSLIGLLLGFVFFPIGGLVIGALGGALVGKFADLGVDQKFVKDVQESIQPGTSALFVIVRQSDPNAAMAALKPYKGELYHSTLSTEAEETLRRALRERQTTEK